MNESFCVVMTTTGSRGEAHDLAEMLVERKLAACVQLINITSIYRWNGELSKEPEMLLLIKTTMDRYHAVEAAIQEKHTYEVPEIVQIPIEQGLNTYLDWVRNSTTDVS